MSVRYQTASPSGIFRNPTATISLTGAHTIACWVYPTTSAGALRECVQLQDSVTANFSSIIEYGGGVAQFTFSEFDAASANVLQLTAAAAINTWHHVALVYDGANSITAYLNGAAVGTDNTPTLGARNNWSSMQTGPFDGDCSDAVFFSAALSAAEIQQLFLTRQPRRRTNLVCYWPHFAGAGRITDYSGNANDGAEFGTPVDGVQQLPVGWGTYAERPAFYEADSGSTPIDGAGTTQTTGTAAVTSSAALAATGTTQTTGSAAVTAAAAIAATGTTQTTGTAAVSSGASAAGSGLTRTTGTAALTAAAALAAAGTTRTTGTAAVTAAAPVAASGSTQCTGTAALTSSAALVATGTTQTTGSAAMLGSMAATGTTQTTGSAAVTSSAGVAAAGATQCTGTAAVTIAYAITAIGNTQCSGAAAMTAAAPISAVGLTQCTGSAVLDTGGGGLLGARSGKILGSRRFADLVGVRRRIR